MPSEERLFRLRLVQALEEAMRNRSAMGAWRSADVVEDVVSSKRDLWEATRDRLARQAAIGIVQKRFRRSNSEDEDPNQGRLFDSEFRVPKSITVEHGYRVEVRKATLAQLRRAADWKERRTRGGVRRSKIERDQIEELRRLISAVAEIAGDDDSMTTEQAERERKKRENKRKQR